MQYHSPKGMIHLPILNVNDVCGIRHVALKISNIDKAFNYIKGQDGIKLINASEKYQPFRIDRIDPDEFRFFDKELEKSKEEKEKVCEIVGNIRYFYFKDKYGVQWEFEQGHNDIGK